MKAGYDERCYELAQYFLTDQPIHDKTEANVASLAQHIQDTVEDWFLRMEQDKQPTGAE
jgi:hypothetical protein